jgi:hypothetical protein
MSETPLTDLVNDWQRSQARIAALEAENGRLREALKVELDDLMESYPSWGMGGGSGMEARAQDAWEADHGKRKKRLRAALSQEPTNGMNNATPEQIAEAMTKLTPEAEDWARKFEDSKNG